MTLETVVEAHGFQLKPLDDRRIWHHLTVLERRLAHQTAPRVEVVLTRWAASRQIEADLRLQLGHLGAHFIGRHRAATAAQATRLAVADPERQLARHLAKTRDRGGLPSLTEPLPEPEPVPSGLVEPVFSAWELEARTHS